MRCAWLASALAGGLLLSLPAGARELTTAELAAMPRPAGDDLLAPDEAGPPLSSTTAGPLPARVGAAAEAARPVCGDGLFFCVDAPLPSVGVRRFDLAVEAGPGHSGGLFRLRSRPAATVLWTVGGRQRFGADGERAAVWSSLDWRPRSRLLLHGHVQKAVDVEADWEFSGAARFAGGNRARWALGPTAAHRSGVCSSDTVGMSALAAVGGLSLSWASAVHRWAGRNSGGRHALAASWLHGTGGFLTFEAWRAVERAVTPSGVVFDEGLRLALETLVGPGLRVRVGPVLQHRRDPREPSSGPVPGLELGVVLYR